MAKLGDDLCGLWRLLGDWDRQENAERDAKKAERQAELDREVEKRRARLVEQRGVNLRSWDDWATKLVAFIRTHQAAPSLVTADRDEHRLANWTSHQKHHRKRFVNAMSSADTRRRWDDLVAEYPRFLAPLQWDVRLSELEFFFKKHGRRPLKHSPLVKEKKLANWMTTQMLNRRQCVHAMLDSAIRERWDDAMKGR